MIYILDDDAFDAIHNVYKCDFIFDKNTNHQVKYYKVEGEIDFKVEQITSSDFVCYHNSFPCDKTFIIQKLQVQNELSSKFFLICFSGASEFYNVNINNKFIKIHKDRFYSNLKLFIDSGFDTNVLLYGSYSKRSEISIIYSRINSILFTFNKDSIFPLQEIQPRDIKRISELANINYEDLVNRFSNCTIEKFRKTMNTIIQNT